MNKTRVLPRLTRWADGCFGEFEAISDSLAPPFSGDERNVVRYIAIEAANAWFNLMRTYYLASATGAWLDDGTRVTGTIPSHNVEDAMTVAVHHERPRLRKHTGPWKHQQEPNWMDPVVVHGLLHSQGLSNANGFLTAISVGSGHNQRLLTFRNFVAHRGRRNAIKVRDLARRSGIVASADPIELPFHRAAKRPAAVFTEWILEIRAIARLLPR